MHGVGHNLANLNKKLVVNQSLTASQDKLKSGCRKELRKYAFFSWPNQFKGQVGAWQSATLLPIYCSCKAKSAREHLSPQAENTTNTNSPHE